MPNSFRPDELYCLAESAWAEYERVRSLGCAVDPAIPVLFFGNSQQYWQSQTRVVTIGKNPSLNEFPQDDQFLRFPNARETAECDEVDLDLYLDTLDSYFAGESAAPLMQWFNWYERILNGFNCSYLGNAGCTALHTDLLSPIATDPAWSELDDYYSHSLARVGVSLWHSLIEILLPNLVFISLKEEHLRKIRFQQRKPPKTFIEFNNNADGTRRATPYRVRAWSLQITADHHCLVIFGQAAQNPFGRLSDEYRFQIGDELRAYFDC